MTRILGGKSDICEPGGDQAEENPEDSGVDWVDIEQLGHGGVDLLGAEEADQLKEADGLDSA